MRNRKSKLQEWISVGMFPPDDLPKDTVELAEDLTILFVLQRFGPYNLEA